MTVFELLNSQENNRVCNYCSLPVETFLRKVRLYSGETEIPYWDTDMLDLTVKDFITYDNNSITIFC